jgi:WD40 repeat protein
LEELIKIDHRDNLFDVCWSEKDPNIMATAGGDGFVQVWNLGNKYPKVRPSTSTIFLYQL